jgi:hypothetical protein
MAIEPAHGSLNDFTKAPKTHLGKRGNSPLGQ